MKNLMFQTFCKCKQLIKILSIKLSHVTATSTAGLAPLHSKSHRNNQKKADDSPISKVLQPLQLYWCSSVPSVSSPSGHFVYYYYVQHGMQWRRPSFSSVQLLFIFHFIQSSYNQHKDIKIVLQIYIFKNI